MEKSEQPRIIQTKKDADEFLYKDPYFAFLDILGFKALVQKNAHSTLVDLYTRIFTHQSEVVLNMHENFSKKRAEERGENYTDAGLRIVNISDSILIWTQHGQPTALRELVFAVSSLLAFSMVQGLPLRGCITRQPFSVIEKNAVVSVIGKGLVHAYNMENIQQWSGCIIDKEIINYFRGIEKHFFQREARSPIEKEGLVYEYDIPFKNLKTGERYTQQGYAVNWSEELITDDIIKHSFDDHNKKDEREGSDTPEKISNTIEFHHFCIEKKKERQAAIESFAKALRQGDENIK